MPRDQFYQKSLIRVDRTILQASKIRTREKVRLYWLIYFLSIKKITAKFLGKGNSKNYNSKYNSFELPFFRKKNGNNIVLEKRNSHNRKVYAFSLDSWIFVSTRRFSWAIALIFRCRDFYNKVLISGSQIEKIRVNKKSVHDE